MAEYIEREAALNATFKILVKRLDTRIKTARDAVRAYANYIAGLPAADVQPVVHGEWIKVGSIENTWLVSKCSACGAQTIDAGCYCPNCGASMHECVGRECSNDSKALNVLRGVDDG